jgi:hypothetical protein
MPEAGVQRISSFLELRNDDFPANTTILQKLIGQIVRRPCKSRNNFNGFIQLKMKFTDTDNFPYLIWAGSSPRCRRTLEGLCNLRGLPPLGEITFCKSLWELRSPFTELPTFGHFWFGALTAVLRPHAKRRSFNAHRQASPNRKFGTCHESSARYVLDYSLIVIQGGMNNALRNSVAVRSASVGSGYLVVGRTCTVRPSGRVLRGLEGS